MALPPVAALSLAGQYLGIFAGLLIGAGLFLAIELGMRRWAWRKAAQQ